MRFVRHISAFLLGTVFFVAGILKLMDPVGTSLVVESYYGFLGMSFLAFSSRYVAVALALVETLTGAAVITGVWKKPAGMVSLVLLAAFTCLTLAIFILNPSMDCGCFGEAVHLTHAQSFYKNLVLLALWAGAFVPFSRLEPARKVKYVSFSLVALSVVLFTLWSVLSIPMIDFTSYAPGEDLLSPYEEEQIQEIPQLAFYDANGDYRNELATCGNVIVVSVYNLHSVTDSGWKRIGSLFDEASSSGFSTLLLVASSPASVEGMDLPASILPNVYFGDRRDYMTLNRSNGGATYIADGQIVCKWAARSVPDAAELISLGDRTPTETMMRTSSAQRLRLQGFLLYVFAVMLLL